MATKKTTKKTAKELSQIEAAMKILARAKKPMTCREMVDAMVAKRLWKSPSGKTPHATLYASILRDIKKGKDARFKKVAPGKFTLTRTRKRGAK